MSDVVTWLRARLDEDEDVARAACHGGTGEWVRRYISCIDDEAGRAVAYGEGTPTPEQADHIALHGPARVLAEVEAKRRLIEQIGQYEAWLDAERGYGCSAEEILAGRCSTVKVDEILALRLLALSYADQPGYKEEWRP